MYVCTALLRKRTNLYVLCSTGNAYDVISYRRLSGPRAPQYFGQVYASDRPTITLPTIPITNTITITTTSSRPYYHTNNITTSTTTKNYYHYSVRSTLLCYYYSTIFIINNL